jgi:hypothetical protein
MVADYFICQSCHIKRDKNEFYGSTGPMYSCPVCGSTDIKPELGLGEFLKQTNELTQPVKKRGEVTPYTIKDILAFTKRTDFLVKDVFYPETVNCMVSEFSGFKSILSMHLAFCVAQGKPFFGYETSKSPVLIIDNENNMMEVRSRSEALIAGAEYKDDIDVHYLMREGKMDNPEFVEYVKGYILDNKIKLVIIDTLLRSHNLEENSSKDMNQLYDAFCSLLINGCSVLFLHHTNKKGTFRGTGDILGQVDCGFSVVRPDKTGPKFILINDKNRMGEIDPIEGTVEYDKKTNVTTIEGFTVQKALVQEEEKSKFKDALIWVENYAEANKQFKRKTLYIDLDAYNAQNEKNQINQRTVKNVLAWMVRKGKLYNGPKQGVYILNDMQSKIIEGDYE